MSFKYRNGFKIRQVETVKQYGIVSVRSDYKEYFDI